MNSRLELRKKHLKAKLQQKQFDAALLHQTEVKQSEQKLETQLKSTNWSKITFTTLTREKVETHLKALAQAGKNIEFDNPQEQVIKLEAITQHFGTFEEFKKDNTCSVYIQDGLAPAFQCLFP